MNEIKRNKIPHKGILKDFKYGAKGNSAGDYYVLVNGVFEVEVKYRNDQGEMVTETQNKKVCITSIPLENSVEKQDKQKAILSLVASFVNLFFQKKNNTSDEYVFSLVNDKEFGTSCWKLADQDDLSFMTWLVKRYDKKFRKDLIKRDAEYIRDNMDNIIRDGVKVREERNVFEIEIKNYNIYLAKNNRYNDEE